MFDRIVPTDTAKRGRGEMPQTMIGELEPGMLTRQIEMYGDATPCQLQHDRG